MAYLRVAGCTPCMFWGGYATKHLNIWLLCARSVLHREYNAAVAAAAERANILRNPSICILLQLRHWWWWRGSFCPYSTAADAAIASVRWWVFVHVRLGRSWSARSIIVMDALIGFITTGYGHQLSLFFGVDKSILHVRYGTIICQPHTRTSCGVW